MGLRRLTTFIASGAIAASSLVLVSAAATPAQAAPLEPADVTFTIDPAPVLEVPPGPSPRASQGPTTSQASVALPALSSRPSSTHTVYLDFDGVTLPSSGFGSDWTPDIDAGTYGGFSLDGDPDFSQAEVNQVTKIWRIIAEKYSPYDLNVTTVDPGTEALRRTNAADVNYGVQAVITDDNSPKIQICGRCAGVAYNDLFDGRQQNTGGGMTVFDTNAYALAWVFSSETGGNAQVTALDAAHEIGHTLGLDHDGGGGDGDGEYYQGHANWVPIMGITNQNAVSQFSKGQYSAANNTQDDLVVISTNGNAGTSGTLTLADDYTTSTGTPIGAAVLGDQTSYEVSGTITNAADDDVFSISRTCTGPLTASAAGIGAGQSLDIKVEIQNSAGTPLVSNDPASGQTFVPGVSPDIGAFEPTGMDASASLASTTSGTTYRIKVDGVGSGNPLNTGYSDYGSIGQYTLSISGCAASPSTVPGPPSSISLQPGVRSPSAQISWTAPASDGGSPITGYQITGLPGGTVNTGNVLTYSASSLVPGTTYPITVKAKNAVGTSSTGAIANLRVSTWEPQTKPGLSASLNNATATLNWSAPANPGNATLTGWHVVGTGASAVDENLGAATLSKNYGVAVGTTTYRVTGLYTADLSGAVASDARSVTRSDSAPTAPSAPGTASATSDADGKGATITWSTPPSDGGAAVTGYTVFGLPGGTLVLGNVLSYSATGLAPGTTYDVIVAARNTAGNGVGTATTLKTNAAPSKPRIRRPAAGAKGGIKSAVARWAAPKSTGGASITSYKVVAYRIVNGKIRKTFVSKALKASVRGYTFRLPRGKYKFRVVAYNAVGKSPGSTYSKIVTSR